MHGLYEDIDEDIDEADDEDIDEDTDEADDEGLSERRRRRRRGPRIRGRNYAAGAGRADRSPVTRDELNKTTARIAEDMRKLAAGVKTAEDHRAAGDARQRASMQNFGMMSALLPLLTRKTITFKEAQANPETKLLSGDSDLLSLMLPMMMMGNMGKPATSNNAAGGMDPMMGMMMVLAFSGGLGGNK